MEVHLTTEQEAQLSQLAAQTGKAVEQLAQEAISRMLDEDARFRAAVRKGFASLDRMKTLISALSGCFSPDAGSLSEV
jgi:predicted transcriptional regulator